MYKKGDLVRVIKRGSGWNSSGKMDYLLGTTRTTHNVDTHDRSMLIDGWRVKFEEVELVSPKAPRQGASYSLPYHHEDEIDYSLIEVDLKNPLKVLEGDDFSILVVSLKFMGKYSSDTKVISWKPKGILEDIYMDDEVSVAKGSKEDIGELIRWVKELKTSPWREGYEAKTLTVKSINMEG